MKTLGKRRNKNIKTLPFLSLVVSAQLAASVSIHATVRYVDVNSASPTPPYMSWATAATNIQEAVDAALAGDEVLVTNGVYRTGGKAVGAFDPQNRVLIDKPLTVHSVNGPKFTIIEGDSRMRCVFMGNEAFLAGFTLTNGNLRQGTGDGAGVYFGTSPSSAAVSNCVIIGCTAARGGGAASPFGSPPNSIGGTFLKCTFANNQATGVAAPFPFDQRAYGGAVSRCRLVHCTLTNNGISVEAPAEGVGGGAYQSVLENCLVVGNSSIRFGQSPGGGAAFSSLVNCTVLQNTGGIGGGVYMCSVTNSIVYDNTGDNHASNNFVAYSCTTPMPANGIGNITNAPLFVNTNGWANLRLQSSSPCINAGNNDHVTSPVDLEGKERIVGGTVDMGAFEWVAVPTHYVSLTSPNPTPPYLSWSTAATNIQDAVDAAVAGDEVLVTNGIYSTGGGTGSGMTNRVAVGKPLSLLSVNGPEFTIIQGHQVPGITNGDSAIRCVYLTDGASLSGFTLTNGATTRRLGRDGGGGVRCGSASAVISNCVIAGNAAFNVGGGVWFGTVINCTLIGNSASHGGGAFDSTLNNCMLIGNSAVYYGGGAYNATLNNCTLTSNSAVFGGGAYSGTLSNCTLTGNWAEVEGGGAANSALGNCDLRGNTSGRYGGGTHSGTLKNCRLTDNTAELNGGGASFSTLNNCTLVGNAAAYGGGANNSTLTNCLLTGNTANEGGGSYSGTLFNCTLAGNHAQYDRGFGGYGGGAAAGTLNNCIVYFNSGIHGANYAQLNAVPTLNYSCTTPQPGSGAGNITNAPLFVDTNGWANLRLQSNSPCINAGDTAPLVNTTDLDGRPRSISRVDMGAYEFQGPFNDYLQQFGLPTDGSADYADGDGDQLNNWQEWNAGTVPIDASSALRLLNPASNSSGLAVSWQSVTNRTYFLERASSLGTPPSFSLLAGNIIGQPGTTSYTDTNASGPFFYRVGVQQ